MTAKAVRGAKRRCQNEECGKPYYDLNRPSPVCPECGTRFEVEAPVLEMVARTGWPARGSGRFPARPAAPLPAVNVETVAQYSGLGRSEEAEVDSDEVGPQIEDVILEEDEEDEGVESTKTPERRHDD